MSEPLRLRTYDDWKHCITQLCRIPLTADYVEARLVALNDERDHRTQRFVEIWGEAHLDRVKAWFVRARHELNAGGSA